jgi:hypothetical protein
MWTDWHDGPNRRTRKKYRTEANSNFLTPKPIGGKVIILKISLMDYEDVNLDK